MTPRYPFADLEAAFSPLQPATAAVAAALPSNVFALPGIRPAAFADCADLPDMNAAAQAGLPRLNWFDQLNGVQQSQLIHAIAAHPAVAALSDQPREAWLKLLFSFADAEHRGAPAARDHALAWCKTSSKFQSEVDFDRDWRSFKPRPGGTTIATLLDAAEKVGFDLEPWRQAAGGIGTAPGTTVVPAQPRSGVTSGSPAKVTPFFSPVAFAAADLHPVQWLVPGLLIRGETTVLTSLGGGAKTAAAIHLAVALSSGRGHVGPFSINSSSDGLRVAIISAEEDANRIGLLVAAACNVMQVNPTARKSVAQNLLIHDARGSGWRLGEPAPGSRQDIAPENEDRSLQVLSAALTTHKPDLVILDTLAALFALPSEIDNNAITMLMRRLGRAARDAGCAVLLLHHTPKLNRAAAAEQRGEATLVRGGSAITNSARVVLTITNLPPAEAAQCAIQGLNPDSVRRLEHAKINDAPHMNPAYFAVTSVLVRVHDGSDQAVRAVEFISPPPPPSAGGVTSDAARNVAMKAIDAGVMDDHGNRVALSAGGGKTNRRDAARVIARHLMDANSSLSEAHATGAARAVLKDLRGRIGCVVDEDVQIPRYKDGRSNGTRISRGLVCRWELAPWMLGGSSVSAASDCDVGPQPDPAASTGPNSDPKSVPDVAADQSEHIGPVTSLPTSQSPPGGPQQVKRRVNGRARRRAPPNSL
jgi:hypothetical protein